MNMRKILLFSFLLFFTNFSLAQSQHTTHRNWWIGNTASWTSGGGTGILVLTADDNDETGHYQ